MAPSGSAPDASIGPPASLDVRQPPIASKFSSAKPSGSIGAWQLAQTGFLRCCSSRSRTDSGLAVLAAFLAARGTSGGGGGGGVPRMFSSSHLPRSTGDVRFGYDVTSGAALTEQAAAALVVVERDPPEVAAVDVRNP